ncbi:MAG: folylpolyglutamate synthase/dihydrofolate synthase family protein [Elusimicrobiales bacterium]|nr:folylpolyglutamate synthase/dihydrofolate synthase family protein [Elusimicrobiales bacterium]
MTLEEAEKYLLSRQNYDKTDGFGRVLACLEKLGSPQRKFRAVHVTGTNGKGSVCALLESSLRAAGYRTGLFISPHLVETRERISVGGENISPEDFAALCSEVAAAGADLSFFETVTCMAFLHFARAGLDLAVLEVGIGGTWDTTNVIPPPELCVITSVDLDHDKYLGRTPAEVAGHKAGIIKKGTLCLCPELPAEVSGVIEKAAAAAGGTALFLPAAFKVEGYDWERNRTLLSGPGGGSELGIIGDRQGVNAGLTLRALEELSRRGFPRAPEGFRTGLENVRWEARFQVLRAAPRGRDSVFILDGAHNPEAVRAFIRTFRASPFAARPHAFVCGFLNDKDYRAMLPVLARSCDDFIFTAPASDKAIPPGLLAEELQRLRPDAGVEVEEEPEAALVSAARRGTAAVLGSFYLAGAAIKILRRAGSRDAAAIG